MAHDTVDTRVMDSLLASTRENPVKTGKKKKKKGKIQRPVDAYFTEK